MFAKSRARRVLAGLLSLATIVGGTSFSEEKKLSVAQLVDQLDSSDPKLRAEAANQLAQQPIVSVTRGTESLKILGSAETGVDLSVVIEELRELTKDPSTDPAFAAHVTLAKLGDRAKEHIAFLSQQIGHSDSKVRLDAICALTKLGSEAYECVPRLVEALDDESMPVKLAAATTLGEIGPAAKPAVGKLKLFLEEIVSFDPTKPELMPGCFTVTLAIAHIGVNPEVVEVSRRKFANLIENQIRLNPEVVGASEREDVWLVKIRVLPHMYKFAKENPMGMAKCLDMVRLFAVMVNIVEADTKAKMEDWFHWKIPMSQDIASIGYAEGDGETAPWRGLLVTDINRETVLRTEEHTKLTPLEIPLFPQKPRTPVVHIPMWREPGGHRVMIPGYVEVPQFDPNDPDMYKYRNGQMSLVEFAIKRASKPLLASSDASMWGNDGMLILSLVFPAKADSIPTTLTFLGDTISIDPSVIMKSEFDEISKVKQ